MATIIRPSRPTVSRPAAARRSTPLRRALTVIAPVSAWVLLMVMLLLTLIVIGWVLLGIVLVGSGPADAQPVPLIVAVLVLVTAGSAWLVARCYAAPGVASLRRVLAAMGVTTALFTLLGVTWALASPDWALFLGRDMAWDGADIHDIEKFPQRAISNAPSAFHFEQKLSPQLFQSVGYTSYGQVKQQSLDDLIGSTHTTSFIVLKDGTLRYEGYANGYARDSVVTSFSMAKSVTSALIGIAIDEGYIGSVNDPMVSYIPELRGKGLDTVTIRHLLTMSAGTRYQHQDQLPGWLAFWPFNDDTISTNYPNFRSLALSVRPGDDPPGSVVNYNTYPPLLLGMILERTTHRPVAQYLQEKIWQPLGMEFPASWSLDSEQSGFEKMAIGINARAIDFAKFGQLFLDNGSWSGKQIIPAEWVVESTSPDPSDNRPWRTFPEWRAQNGYYKYLWLGLTRPGGSYAYMATGGVMQQWIYVSPSDGAVIVRLGLDSGGVDWWPALFQAVVDKVE